MYYLTICLDTMITTWTAVSLRFLINYDNPFSKDFQYSKFLLMQYCWNYRIVSTLCWLSLASFHSIYTNNSRVNGVLGHNSELLRLYWTRDNLGEWDEICKNHVPGTGQIAQPVDLQSSVLPCHGCSPPVQHILINTILLEWENSIKHCKFWLSLRSISFTLN